MVAIPVDLLLNATKSVARLQDFLYGGDVVPLFVDPLLGAAKAAFSKAHAAKEPRQQVWSAVNHLEAAHETLRAIHSKAKSAPHFFDSRDLYLERIARKDEFVLCLMACCYKVLGDETLCRRALAEAERVDSGRFSSIYSVAKALNLLDVRLWREGYYRFSNDAPKVDVQAFRNALID